MALFLAAVVSSASAAQAVGSGGVNAPEHADKPYLVLVSLDGFRWDYQDLYDAPALDRIAENGVRAERMLPVFPTLTFPNHYSIATGLFPANHRLIGNHFPGENGDGWYTIRDREAVQDGRWYAGEPVWVAAEKAGMVTAAYFFVGTEADIQGVEMTHWNAFDQHVPSETRVTQVLDWLALPAAQRPHLVTLYFETVDSVTHKYGPGSAESIAAISEVNVHLEQLLDGIEALPHGEQVYVVVVSDHGQLPSQFDREIMFLDAHVAIEGLTIVDHASSVYIWLSEAHKQRARQIVDAINANWDHGRAILREEAPEAWRVTAEAGFADVIVMADPGYLVASTPEKLSGSLGNHGWSPEAEGMHAIFLAQGPRLPNGQRIGPIRAVDVYPLMLQILGLPVPQDIDGDPGRLLPLLDSE